MKNLTALFLLGLTVCYSSTQYNVDSSTGHFTISAAAVEDSTKTNDAILMSDKLILHHGEATECLQSPSPLRRFFTCMFLESQLPAFPTIGISDNSSGD